MTGHKWPFVLPHVLAFILSIAIEIKLYYVSWSHLSVHIVKITGMCREHVSSWGILHVLYDSMEGRLGDSWGEMSAPLHSLRLCGYISSLRQLT